MATVSALFRRRWKTGAYVGSARPFQQVFIRRGRFHRSYKRWHGNDFTLQIPESPTQSMQFPWQADWTPIDDYREIPNVGHVSLQQDFTQNGITQATIDIDNVVYQDRGGWHAIMRGWFSPMRARWTQGRPRAKDALGAQLTKNEWFWYLNQAAQILVVQGYGDETVQTYTGLIDELDLKAAPDQIAMTCRDFGQVFEQRLVGNVRDPSLHNVPIIFADRRSNENNSKVGSAGPHDCSSHEPGCPPRYVTTTEGNAWRSRARDRPDATEWVEIHVPWGNYDEIYLWPAYRGMDVYISVRPGARGHINQTWPTREDGWIDLGLGEVGGVPYIKRFRSLPHKGAWRKLGRILQVNDDTIIRVSFRNLRRVHGAGAVWDDEHGGYVYPNENGTPTYRAGCRRLTALRRLPTKHARKNRWILCDDVADIVRQACIWAGFKEWNIEDTGVAVPPTKIQFDHSNTLLDMVRKAQEATNYVWFMDDPNPDNPDSIGVPTFRSPAIFNLDEGRRARGQLEQLTDKQLITGLQAKWQRASLPERFIALGAISGKRGRAWGEGYLSKRLMSVYTPPWVRRRMDGGLLRYEVASYEYLTTQKQVDVMARLVALAGALQSLTATVETPANPAITLDSLVGVLDLGTGLNTRLYVATRTSEFVNGDQVSWKMTLGGALVDWPDVRSIMYDLRNILHPPEPRDAYVFPSDDPNAWYIGDDDVGEVFTNERPSRNRIVVASDV